MTLYTIKCIVGREVDLSSDIPSDLLFRGIYEQSVQVGGCCNRIMTGLGYMIVMPDRSDAAKTTVYVGRDNASDSGNSPRPLPMLRSPKP